MLRFSQYFQEVFKKKL